MHRKEIVPVDGSGRAEAGGVPIEIQGPEEPGNVPGLVVVPSIFGPAPDLLRQMEGLAGSALTVVMDPFWRRSGGAIPYTDRDAAFARLAGFDRELCFADLRAVIAWTRERCSGRVAGLGICFGGPFVLVAAAEGNLEGVVTWHGSRMENVLDRADAIHCPLRLHFGSADPITPPEVIEKIQAAFAGHPDATFVVYPGLDHGFSHEGRSYDAKAAARGVDDTRALLESLAS